MYPLNAVGFPPGEEPINILNLLSKASFYGVTAADPNLLDVLNTSDAPPLIVEYVQIQFSKSAPIYTKVQAPPLLKA